ncbi:cytochrome C-type biogenesis protein (ccdA), conjectural [Roseibacterium elongatum DSM 19469]|uniref:Cytochrome C-type biogenesis protein (CcdA), conjectural n=1 Tax=Roseicyclus elongatus DSM 19469 TaxID=1294273 RepID=W8SL92_9RHOB|nr:cytochrome c biogenesis CcdA family protein [Roseibacterium elongatum]AHM03310.1 cytochrome C-type biogenesis protein (ccdA), conjectural [Roseibacterium elongatum DSM 19469]
MELVLSYAAGLLTLINPCVLPVLPIVLAGALQASRWGPVALAAGMGLAFVTLGFGVIAAGHLVGLTEQTVARAGAVLMIAFGLVLLIPQASARFATATAGMSARADQEMHGIAAQGWQGQFMGGLLLGAVWSPCVGPTLGGAISLASQGEELFRAFAIMVFFALGIGTVIVLLGYGARSVLQRRVGALRRFAHASRPVLGGVFLFVGVAILLRWHHMAEAWLLDRMPIWLQDLSVAL